MSLLNHVMEGVVYSPTTSSSRQAEANLLNVQPRFQNTTNVTASRVQTAAIVRRVIGAASFAHA